MLNDMMSWLQNRQAEQQRRTLDGTDLHHVTELGQAMSEGVKHLAEITSEWVIWFREGFKGDSTFRRSGQDLGDAVTVTEEPVHLEFDMTLQGH